MAASQARGFGEIHSTSTTTVVVAFRHTQTDPAAAAVSASRQPAWTIAGATAVSARALRSDAAAVTFDTVLTRDEASQISSATAKMSAVKYAEPSVTFYPTDAGGSGYYWNLNQINAAGAWTAAGKGKSDVVVGVIDTGIADNSMLPKALIVNTIGGVISGTAVSGTTWPGRTVTVSYTSGGQSKSSQVVSDANTGAFTVTLNPLADNGTTVIASVPNGSGTPTQTDPITVDSTVTEFSVAPSNGSSFHGTVEPGSKVSLSFDPWKASAVVTGGTWTLAQPGFTFSDGDVVTVTATDPRGNIDVAKVTIDQVSHLEVVSPSSGAISGTAEAGSAIAVTHEGEQLCTATAADDATFGCTISDPEHDWTVDVSATDLAGNTTTKTVTIDTKAPELHVDPSNGTRLTGTVTDEGPAGRITITATYPDGSTGTTTTSGANWTITGLPAVKDLDQVSLTATDAAGNVGTASVTIDLAKPDAPTVSATNGETVNGTGEAGAKITVDYYVIVSGYGKRVVTTSYAAHGVVADDGTWSLSLDPAASDNSWLTATVIDLAGNVSDPTKLQVHLGKPSAPTVAVSDGLTVNLSGVEDGATPSLVDANGEVVASQPTDHEDGSWTLTPATALTESDAVYAWVTDSAGVTSDKVKVIVDTTAPDAPQISAADTDSVSGTGEADATITVRYPTDNDPSAKVETTVGSDGQWAVSLNPKAEESATITVTQTDAAGHVSPEASVTLTAPAPTPEPDPQAAGNSADDATTPAAGSADAVGTSGSGTVLPGYDVLDGDHNPSDPGTETKGAYHGTHVAGIVASSGTGLLGNHPISGVAPGVKILPIRALGDGGTLLNITDAINWAVDSSRNPYPADVLNLSLGAAGTTCPQTLQTAINGAIAKGTVVVVSAGNDGTDVASQAPANCSGVIVVTATTSRNTRADYTNVGSPNTKDRGYQLVAAPGGSGHDEGNCNPAAGWACTDSIVSTFNNGVAALSGTSMAAPQVAATAALLKSVDKSLSPAKISAYIRSKATPLADGCPTGVCGSGVVNAAAAVAAAKAGVAPNSGSTPSIVVPNAVVPANYQVSWPKTTRVGQKAEVLNGSTNYGATYQWYRQWYKRGKKVNQAISGATASSYTVRRSDYGKYLWVKVTHVWGTTNSSNRSRSKVATGNLRVVSPASISGTTVVGQRLTAHKPVWSDSVSSTKYQWYRNGKKISKATKSGYTLTKSDRGKRISVKVSVKSSRYYSTSTTSAATAVVQ